MKKIFVFLLAILLCFTFVTKVRASTVLDINTTDCSGQGGTGNGSNLASACNNTVNTESGTLQTGWGGAGHPVIHIMADVSDTLSLTIDTPSVFLPNYTYTAVEWTTTLTNWNGWIGGAMFDCNGSWGCPTVTFAPGGGIGWQGTATATGNTDYYIVVASQCQGVSSGCFAHLTVSCSNCSVAGLTPPPPQPQLTVIKSVVNDNGGTANAADFTLNVGTTTVTSGVINSFDANTYTVTEAGPEGYIGTFGGDCDSNGQITLQTGDQPKICTLTNDDIAPPPVTKILLIPGMGASWNANALLNCQPDTDPSHWSLASYAEGIYRPILDALPANNWVAIPYFYDWRQNITNDESKNKFADFINQNTAENEKINIVGHSMGGLVGREYLEASGSAKLNSLLTVGTPHKGAVNAYPAWAGGDVWNDNFLAKIATTLYVKHCSKTGGYATDKEAIQNIFPSIENLLPTSAYLKPTKSYTPPDIYNMTTKNNWLLNNGSGWPNIGNVKIGSLSGSTFSTLSSIPVKETSPRDKSLGLWTDGKPAGKEFSIDGDGTVLTTSSKIFNTDPVINQTHSGLVASSDGICKILEFLGTPCTASATTFVEPNSALVIIGYPSNFWITDQNGNSKKDKDGMVAYINPKSGSYKLNLTPKSSNTLFIVAQFLPNGDVKYKEYKFDGFGPKFKTLKFDLQNPQEDILN